MQNISRSIRKAVIRRQSVVAAILLAGLLWGIITFSTIDQDQGVFSIVANRGAVGEQSVAETYNAKYKAPRKPSFGAWDILSVGSTEWYIESQNAIASMISACTKGEQTSISWDLKIRKERDLRKAPIAAIALIAAGVEVPDEKLHDKRYLREHLIDMMNTTLRVDVRHVQDTQIIAIWTSNGRPTVNASISSQIVCYPIDVYIPIGRSGGLCHDAALYAYFLKGRMVQGFEQRLSDFLCPDTAHLTLEKLRDYFNSNTRTNFHMANWELFDVQNTDVQHQTLIQSPVIDAVLCKTYICHALFYRWHLDSGLASALGHPVYLSHSSVDHTPKIGDSSFFSLRNFSSFFHLSGASPYKNTAAVEEAWVNNTGFPTLYTVTSLIKSNADNIDKSSGISHLELAQKMVNHSIHLCASTQEGFGHYLNEGRSTGAVIISTDFPPMNELVHDGVNGFLIEPEKHKHKTWQLMSQYVEPTSIFSVQRLVDAVKRAIATPIVELEKMGNASRRLFLEQLLEFVQRSQVLAAKYLIPSAYHPFPLLENQTSPYQSMKLGSHRNFAHFTAIGTPNIWFRSDFTSFEFIHREAGFPYPSDLLSSSLESSDPLRILLMDAADDSQSYATITEGLPRRVIRYGHPAILFPSSACFRVALSPDAGTNEVACKRKSIALKVCLGEDVERHQVIWREGQMGKSWSLSVHKGKLALNGYVEQDRRNYAKQQHPIKEPGNIFSVSCLSRSIRPFQCISVMFELSIQSARWWQDEELLYNADDTTTSTSTSTSTDSFCVKHGVWDGQLLHYGPASIGCNAGSLAYYDHSYGRWEYLTEKAYWTGMLYDFIQWDRPSRTTFIEEVPHAWERLWTDVLRRHPQEWKGAANESLFGLNEDTVFEKPFWDNLPLQRKVERQ